MGATILGNTIYISKELDGKLTRRERRIILAHELGHYKHKDRILLIAVTLLFFWCPMFRNYFKRWCEIRADRYALNNTKDYASFVSLMDKLQHDKKTHPTKEQRLQAAENMRGKLCQVSVS